MTLNEDEVRMIRMIMDEDREPGCPYKKLDFTAGEFQHYFLGWQVEQRNALLDKMVTLGLITE